MQERFPNPGLQSHNNDCLWSEKNCSFYRVSIQSRMVISVKWQFFVTDKWYFLYSEMKRSIQSINIDFLQSHEIGSLQYYTMYIRIIKVLIFSLQKRMVINEEWWSLSTDFRPFVKNCTYTVMCKYQSQAPVQTRHRLIDAKAKIRRVTRCREFKKN